MKNDTATQIHSSYNHTLSNDTESQTENMSESNIQIIINGEDINSLIDKLNKYEQHIHKLESELDELKNNKKNKVTKKYINKTQDERCKARIWNGNIKDKHHTMLCQCTRVKSEGEDYCNMHLKPVTKCYKTSCKGKGVCHNHLWEHFGNIDQDIIDICPEHNIGYELVKHLKNMKDKRGIDLDIEKEILSDGEKNPNVQNINEQYDKIPSEYKDTKKNNKKTTKKNN